MRVLVAGASGFVGSHLLPALSEAGHDVVALVRDAAGYDPPIDADVHEGDLLDAASLDGAFDGVDAAYYLVHSMRAGDEYEARDRVAAQQFAAAATDAGVDRAIYLSGLGADDAELSEHLRSRREIESILARGGYDLTTLRAAVVIGPGSASFRIVHQLAARLPVMITPQWVRVDCQPIAIADVVAYLVGVLDAPGTAGGTYEIGGPEVLTYEAMLRRTGAILGREPLIVPAPVLSPRLSARWVDLFTDLPREMIQPLIEGLKTPVVVTDDSIREHVVVDPTPFDEAVRRAIRAETDRSVTLASADAERTPSDDAAATDRT